MLCTEAIIHLEVHSQQMIAESGENDKGVDSNAAQQKLDQLLRDITSWTGEVGQSLERSEDYIKQRMQFFDRLAVLSGAILAFSVPAFTTLRSPTRIITHPHLSLGFAISGWICLFLATIVSALAHHSLVEFYAVWTNEHERSVRSVLFHNINLSQKRLLRETGGNMDALIAVPQPTSSFQRKPRHEALGLRLALSERTAMMSCIFGASFILLFLVCSSF
jgi:hypothetical protein